MKLTFIFLVLMMLISPTTSFSENVIYTDFDDKEYNVKIERTAYIIAGVVQLGICIWGIQQDSTYGTLTGIYFGTKSGINFTKAIIRF